MKNNWPKWLPYPISWIRAFALNYVLVALFQSNLPFRHGNDVVVALIGAWVTVPFLFAFFHWAISGIAAGMLANLPENPKFDIVRNYLNARPLRLRQSHWREGLNAFIVSFVAFFVSAVVLYHVLPAPSREFAYENNAYLLRRAVLHLRLNLIPIGMTLVSAYLYQYDLWARQRRAAKATKSQPVAKQEKVKRSPARSPVDPIEQELNQMKTASGMTRVKATKQASMLGTETPQWYVFRSGQAEGPYTKLQLLEVQQITARTKVRRGESDWQRAGEISELEVYLTEK